MFFPGENAELQRWNSEWAFAVVLYWIVLYGFCVIIGFWEKLFSIVSGNFNIFTPTWRLVHSSVYWLT